MIIDDDDILLDVLPATLRLKLPGLGVETFNSVELASARLRGDPFNVILADLTMPQGDGLQIIAEAKAQHPSTPVIAMSGCWDERLGRAALAAGAYDLLWKPLDREELAAVLRCALMMYRLQGLIDRQNLKVRRLQELVVATTQHHEARHPHFTTVLDRVRRLQEQSLHRIMANIEVLREHLAGHLDTARTRADGHLHGSIRIT